MNYNITLDMVTYIIVLSLSGSLGSCYQSHKATGTTKPFIARLLCGTVAGLITMLAVQILNLGDQALIHFGVAAILGILTEKGEGLGRILDTGIIKVFTKEVK